MVKCIYSNNGGLGLILDSQESILTYTHHEEYKIGDQILQPEDVTDLFGLFSEPVLFIGALCNTKNAMVFYLGSDENLFETKRYYSVFFWISPTRVCNKYTLNSVRDFHLQGGKFK